MPHAASRQSSPGRAAATLQPADALLQLDAEVSAFLDTMSRKQARPSKPEQGVLILPNRKTPGVSRTARALPLLVYLTVADDVAPPRTPALQMIANEAPAAVRHVVLPALGDARTMRHRLAEALNSIDACHHDIDTECFALGGDGLGAAAAFDLALDHASQKRHCLLVILATPILSQPSASPVTSWMPMRRATALAGRRTSVETRLARIDPMSLPPILSITAEADVFRDGAEALVRRLMAAGADVTALRSLGAIHDFTWLPELVDAPCSASVRQIMADALRRHLPCPEKECVLC